MIAISVKKYSRFFNCSFTLGFFVALFIALALPVKSVAQNQNASCQNITVTYPGFEAMPITFQLQSPRPCGQYVNGDWWVQGPVTITAMEPMMTAGRHGFAVNPDPKINHYDNRAPVTFRASATTLPLRIDSPVPVSVVKTRSYAPELTGSSECKIGNESPRSCIASMAVLTVVPSAPSMGSFRPPVFGNVKPTITLGELDLSKLPRFPKVNRMPSFQDVNKFFNGPFFDPTSEWGGRMLHARANMLSPNGTSIDYGTDVGIGLTTAILRTMHDDPIEQKLPTVIRLVQAGIDLYHQLLGGQIWPAGGGHMVGRKLPILYTGKLLNNKIGKLMLNVGQSHKGTGPLLANGQPLTNSFSEDGHTFFGASGQALYGATLGAVGGKFGGSPRYENYLNGGCRSGPRDVRDPEGKVDGGVLNDCNAMPSIEQQIASNTAFNSAYQGVVSRPYVAIATAARLLGLEQAWNHAPLFRYAERWMSPPWNALGVYGSPYAETMYNTYYHALPAAAPMPTIRPVPVITGAAQIAKRINVNMPQQ